MCSNFGCFSYHPLLEYVNCQIYKVKNTKKKNSRIFEAQVILAYPRIGEHATTLANTDVTKQIKQAGGRRQKAYTSL